MITLEVNAIERMADKSYKITLVAKSSTIYEHMCFIHLSADEAKGVAIGDKWVISPADTKGGDIHEECPDCRGECKPLNI